MYLRLDVIQPKLEAWIQAARKKGEWDGNVVINSKGEIVEPRMKGGLRPSPITRDLTWGVPVAKTGDGEEDAAMEGKVMCEFRDRAPNLEGGRRGRKSARELIVGSDSLFSLLFRRLVRCAYRIHLAYRELHRRLGEVVEGSG